MKDTALERPRSAVALAMGFLIAVNLLAGLAAEGLGYPSLWTASREVFAEYALPLPLTWGLAHWATMGPLAFLIAALPRLTPARLRTVQAALGIGLLLALAVEVDLAYGKLEKIPFALFAIVDFTVALLITLCYAAPLKLLAGAAVAIPLLVVTTAAVVRLTAPQPETAARPAPVRGAAAGDRLFSDRDLAVRWVEQEIRLTLLVADPVGPGVGPAPADICSAARAAWPEVAELHRQHPEFDAYIQFLAPKPFDDKDYVYPAGDAVVNRSGEFQCRFHYPQRAATATMSRPTRSRTS